MVVTVSAHHGVVEKRWLESEPQACGKNLATGGLKVPKRQPKRRAAVVKRRFLCASAPPSQTMCVL